MLTASQRFETDNSYHVATASPLATFPGFAAFSVNREKVHSSLQLLEQPQKVDSTENQYTLDAKAW